MRKVMKAIVGIALALVWCVAAVQFLVPGGVLGAVSSLTAGVSESPQINIVDMSTPLAAPSFDGVAQNGWLRVREGKLVNTAGKPFQLRGMSSHGLAWFPQYTGLEAIATTKSYGANLFRVAMYADDTPGNYTTNAEDQQANTNAMIAAIDNVLSLDMYAIVDWHIMEDGNPLNRVDDAIAFFDAISARYASSPGVIYEICNEPNGDTGWDDIYAYATQVIPVIRANAPDAIVLVGTPQYTRDLWSAIEKQLPYNNVMYAYHYYADVRPETYRTILAAAQEAKVGVFVTEWGIGLDFGVEPATDEAIQEAADFVRYLHENSISWANWSLCNKDESFSAILPSVSALGGWTEDDLTISGKLVFGALSQ